jgi:glycosyltransferase involved in cell wall biosynthesis
VARIVGIVLVRNEDLFIEQAVRNVLDFCDEILLADNGSTDGTLSILAQLAARHPDKLRLCPVARPAESHDLIAPLAGQDVWVFGIDGDELYDPDGLRAFRPRLLGGEFDDWWLIRSNALHTLELTDGTARGHMAPPAPSMVKLHNFASIESWGGSHPERLHGQEGLRFKPGREGRKLNLERIEPWDSAQLRALHVCFLRRSSLEASSRERPNIRDANTPRRAPVRLARTLLRRRARSQWKDHYRQGPVVTVDATPFLRHSKSAS